MISITLEPDLDVRLDALAARSGRSKDDYVREAILRGLDMQDIAAADAVMECVRRGEERIYSSAEIRKELGLND